MEDPTKEILNRFGFSNVVRLFLRTPALTQHLFPLLVTELLRKVDKACKGRAIRVEEKDKLKIEWVKTNKGRIMRKESYDALIFAGIKAEDL